MELSAAPPIPRPTGRFRRAVPDRPLRILHIAEAFGGGVYEMTRLQAEGAADAGHEVAIAYGRRPETPEDVRAAVRDDIEVFETPWTTRTLSAQMRAARMLDRLIVEWAPDVIHLQSSFAGVVGASVLRRHGVPLAYTPHGYAFSIESAPRHRRAAFNLLERVVAARVSVIGTTSASEAHQARTEVGAERGAVVENGIPELDSVPGRSHRRVGRPLVMASGRIRPQRQPMACARMLRRVSDIAEVRWVGGGDMATDEAHALVDSGVEVLGWVSRHRALHELASSSVYLHWTAWDGLPLSVLEAMACDAVVVASDIPANREVLGPEQVFGDENRAVAFIRRVLEDRTLAERLLAAQRMRASHYSRKRMVDDWLAIYADLVAA